MEGRYEIVAYSIDNLIRLIQKHTPNNREQILSRSHHSYFDGYFGQVGCRSIVLEEPYVDRDYLEDYSGYYVRCFENYQRTCTRLHFFRCDLPENEFAGLLEGRESTLSQESLQEAYLGFVVLKPLPSTPIGRTCLKTYEHAGRRHYPIIRRYEANLFGISLAVDSLAFQEQDTVVAACATSALWSTFHGTGMLFQHAIPSPLEITKSATNSLPLETRALPNSGGLNAAAMAHAIRHVGLEPYNVNVSHDAGLLQKAAFYAYLRGHIPIIFCITLFQGAPGAHKYFGSHAVAVTGFSLAGAAPVTSPPTGLLLRASRMDKIYVHDDGVGPFARMQYDGVLLSVNGTNRLSLSTGWLYGGVVGNVRAVPEILIVPLYHKIRITFAELHDTVFAFDTFIQALRTNVPLSYTERLEWDVYLTKSGDIKAEFFKDPAKTGPTVSAFLVKSLPRYIWRATGRIGERVILDLIFDATDIQHGNYFVDAVEVEPEMRSLIEDAANLPAVEAQHSTKAEWKVIRGFKKK